MPITNTRVLVVEDDAFTRTTVCDALRFHGATIVDNGLGPASGAPGLGSRIFDLAGPAPWQLERRPDAAGSILRLTVELAGSVGQPQ